MRYSTLAVVVALVSRPASGNLFGPFRNLAREGTDGAHLDGTNGARLEEDTAYWNRLLQATSSLSFTPSPIAQTSSVPSATPSARPSYAPSAAPLAKPSAAPIAPPSASPSASPSAAPSASPSAQASAAPIPSPSATPSASPLAAPSASPSAAPSSSPSASPSAAPSASPSASPSAAPTVSPDCVVELDVVCVSNDGVQVSHHALILDCFFWLNLSCLGKFYCSATKSSLQLSSASNVQRFSLCFTTEVHAVRASTFSLHPCSSASIYFPRQVLVLLL